MARAGRSYPVSALWLQRRIHIVGAPPPPQITAIVALDSGSTTSNLTDYTTGTVTPTTGRVLVVVVQMAGIAAAVDTVVTGLGGTWTRAGGVKYATSYDLSVHTCANWSGSGTLNLNNTDGATNCLWYVIEVGGADTSTPIVPGSIVTTSPGSVNTATITLNSPANSGNRPIAAFGNSDNNTVNQATPRANWTELAPDVAIATPGGVLQVQARTDAFETTASVDWIGGPYTSAGVAFEMKAAGATEHTRTPADTLGLTDARAIDLGLVVTDALGLTDAGQSKAFTATGTDLLGLTDSVTAQLVVEHTRTVNDTLGLTDARAVEVGKAVTDALGLTDAAAVVSGHVRQVDDTLGLTDARSPEVGKALTDALGLTDSVSVAAGKLATVDDSLGLTDTASVVAGFTRTATDTLGLTDAVTAQLAGAGARTVDDTLGLTDAVAKNIGVTVPMRQGVAVPAYFNPTTQPAVWDALMANHTGVPFIVVNPASGPGGSADPDYTTRINAARAAGIKCFGYVDTNYGAVAAATADAEIDAWRSLYGVDGIFFDRTPGDTATVAYMTARANKVRATGAVTERTVVVNPGWFPADEAHVSLAEHAMVFENDYATLVSTPEAWYPAYLSSGAHPPDRFWWAFYNASFAQMLDVLSRARRWRVGLVYVTDDTISPLPYDSLPTYWAGLLSAAWSDPGEHVGLTDAGQSRTLTATGTDTLGLIDSVSPVLTSGGFTRTATDTLGLTDADTSQVFDVAETLTDPLGLTDSVSAQTTGGHTRTVDDGLGLTDSRAFAQTATPADSLGLTDNVAVQTAGAGTRTIDDTVGLVDAVTQVTPYVRTVSDTLGLTDARTPEVGKAPTDNLGLADSRSVEVGKNPTDTVGLTDSISVVMSWVRTVDDLLTLTDGAPQAGVFTRAQTDPLGLTDTVSASVLSTTNQSRTDALGLTSSHQVVLSTIRPSLGITIRPATGTTARPYAGTTSRYPFIPD